MSWNPQGDAGKSVAPKPGRGADDPGGNRGHPMASGQDNKSAARSGADARLALACGVAIALRTYQLWLLNNGIFPTAGEVFAPSHEAHGATSVLLELFVLVGALRAPRFLRPRPLLAATLGCCALGAALLVLAPLSPGGITAGLVLRGAGSLLATYSLGIALSQVGEARAMAVSAGCAVLAATWLAALVPAPGLRVSALIDALLTLAALALTWRAARPVLERTAEGPNGSAQAFASPYSFLLPDHQVFVLMFAFAVAVGFGTSLRIDGFTPLRSNLSIVLLACVVAWFLFAPTPARQGREDALFTASTLLVGAGLLAAPLEGLPTGTANALLYAGKLAFAILQWTALAALCARNPAGSMMVLACGEIAGGVGALLGVELGGLCTRLLVDHPQMAAAVTSAAVLALLAYALTGLRGFSFSETIRQMEPAPPLPSPQPPAPSRDELLNVACDELAAACGLTDRELEVLGMLARGHNGYHIRDALTISYNTARTHVKRIYRKLGVHSQQELIDMVEQRAGGQDATVRQSPEGGAR